MIERSAGSSEPVQGSVILCIRTSIYILSGQWTWELRSDAVYCSDVMDFPQHFEGTKGLVHPDDMFKLTAALQVLQDGAVGQLDFRLITTFGEVKAISGQHIVLDAPSQNRALEKQKPLWEDALQHIALQHEAAYLQQRITLADAAEKLYNIGSWAINKSTGEVWYSDGMYYIHSLPPQSLNHHADTFQSFLHPEDRLPFLDVFETAYRAELPLHLEYRILLPGGESRMVRLVSAWNYNNKGQAVFTGILHDLSANAAKDEEVNAAQATLQLHQQVLKLTEQSAHTGYWVLNLVTRKIAYSRNCYRLYGLKPQASTVSDSFLNLVHPSDRLQVQKIMDDMYSQHQLTEGEFRIIRSDGRLRHLKLHGRAFTNGGHLLIIGVVQDVTVQRGLEKKIAELNDKLALHEALRMFTERLSQTGCISWYPDGRIGWSENVYDLLGYKPFSIEPTPQLLHQQVHPNDLKALKEAESGMTGGQLPEGVRFRILNKKGQRLLHIAFYHPGTEKEDVVFGIIRDMSEQGAVHQKLSDTATYAEMLTNAVSEMVLLTDADNTVLGWNRAAEEKTGLKAADALYNNLFDLFPQLLDETYMARLQAVRNGTEMREMKARNLYLRKTHNYLLAPVKSEDGRVTRILHVVQDISRERDLQLQLSERLNFIESLVEASVDRIVVLDGHLNYLYWNKKAEEYYAISKSHVIGHNVLEVFPAFRNDPSYVEFRKVLRGETVYLPPLLTAENPEYFETYLIPLKNELGDVTGILWIVHDLSNEYHLQQAQKETLRQLAVEHQRLKEAQAIGRVGSFEWNASNDTVLWSDEMYRIHGLAPQSEALNLERVLSFVHPNDAHLLHPLIDLRKQPGRFDITHRIITAQGFERIVRRSAQSFAGADGVVTHLVGTLQDITKQIKAQEQIRDQSHFLQRITATTPDMISVIELATGHPAFLNEDAFTANGFAANLMLARSAEERREMIYPDDQPVLHHYFAGFATATDEDTLTAEYRAKTDAGEWRWFYVRGKVFQRNSDGHPTHVLNVIENITSRKQAEEELVRVKDQLTQQATDKYLSLFQSIDQGFCIIEMLFDAAGHPVDFRFLEANLAFEKQTGLTNVPGRTMKEMVPAHEAYWFETLGRIAKTGKPERFRNEAVAMGRYYDVYAFRIDNPEDFHVAILFNDITVHKREEKNASFLSDISKELVALEHIGDTVEKLGASIGRHFGVGWCMFSELDRENEVSVAAYGWNREDLPSLKGTYHVRDYFTPEQLKSNNGELYVCSDTQADPNGNAANYAALGVRSFLTVPLLRNLQWAFQLSIIDTNVRHWQPDEIELLKEVASRIWHRVERARAEEALRQSEEKYRWLFESMATGFVVCDPIRDDTGKMINHRLIQVNPAVVKLTGWKTNEIVGKTIRDLLPDIEEWWLTAFQRVIDTKETIRIENYVAGLDAWYNATAFYYGNDQFAVYFEDVTGRRQAEEALRKSEETFRSYVTASSDIVYKMSADWETMYQLEGKDFLLSTSNATSSWMANYIPDFEKQRVQHAIAEAIQAKKIFALEHQVFNVKGNLSWVFSRAVPLLSGKGEIIEWIGAATDITVRKTAEENLQNFAASLQQEVARQTAELQKNLAILQQAEGLAQMGSWEYNRETGTLNWSEGLYALVGLSGSRRVTVQTYLELAVDEDRTVAKSLIKYLQKGQQDFDAQIRIKRNAETRLLKIKAQVQRSQDDNNIRITGVVVDITDVREAEQKLEESRSLLEQTGLASPDAIVVYDLYKKLPVYVNNRLAEWLGTTSDKLVYMGVEKRLAFIHPEHRLQVLHFNEKLKAITDITVLTIEYRLQVPDDRLMWVRNRSKVFRRNAAGEVTHVLSVLQDITEEKAAAEVLLDLNVALEQKNAELAAAHEEITAFAFVASHDLREPLRKIHTFNDWLLTKEKGLSADGRQTVDKINHSAKHLQLLIDDILTLTKIHAEKDTARSVDLNVIVQRLQTEMHEKLQASRAVIETDPLPMVFGVEAQLFYLFKNLVSNGIKFQPPGQVPHIIIRAEKVDHFLRISFVDNGIGIDQAHHQKIFEIFRRLHAGSAYTGTGMGLTICKKIMEKHGGKITVESEKNRGATFHCWFPSALLF